MDVFAAQRDAANFRSITRSDPAVLEILETAVHSTLYHYLKTDGPDEYEWVKQKAEGPMFIVRRSTNPEYAVFMLNRASLKNVTIPLVKGEMMAKPTGANMLQIRQRGEKFMKGVWFGEDESVKKFEEGITRICGPPSQRPESVNPAAHRPITPQTVTDGMGGDGFSRLFAGLLNSPAGNGTPPPQPSQPAPAPAPAPVPVPAARLPSPPQPQHLHQPIPVAAPSLPSYPSQDYHISPFPAPNAPTSPAAASPAPKSLPPTQEPFTPPPGQTVDDLLNSILGVGAGGTLPGRSAAQGQLHPPQAFQRQPPPHQPQPQAQAVRLPPAGTAPPPIPLDTKPEALHLMHQSARSELSPVPTAGQNGLPSHTSPGLLPPSGPLNPMNANHLLAGIQANFSPPPPQPRPVQSLNANDLLAGIQSTQFSQQHPTPTAPPLDPRPAPAALGGPGLGPSAPTVALVESVVDALGGVGDLRPGGRDGFVRVLEGLVRNEPRFVDDIWQGYLRRMGGG